MSGDGRPLPPSFETIFLGEALDREATLDAFVLGLRRGPRLTVALLVLLVGVHLGVSLLDYASGRFGLLGALAWAQTPLALTAAGARVSEAVAIGQTWRLMSAVLLHADWIHLGLNGLALFGLGRICEAIFGPARLLALFVVAGLGGSVLSQLGPTSMSVGASGAVFGLMGACMSFGWRYRDVLPHGLRRLLLRGLAPWVVLNLVIGFTVPRIDNLGHIGGLIAGTLCALLIQDRIIPGPPQSASRGGAMAGLCAGVLGWSLMNAGWSVAEALGRY